MSFTYTNISDIGREKVFYRSVSFGSVLVRFNMQCCLSVDDYWAGCRWLKWQEAAQGYGCLPDKWHRGHTTRDHTNAKGKKRTPSGKPVTDHCHVLCILVFSIQFYFLLQFLFLSILMFTLGNLFFQINGNWFKRAYLCYKNVP